MAVPTYTKAGAKAATAAKLDKSVFGLEVRSHELLKQAYTAYLANGRTNNARTLKRGEVSGGGRKPWKQKGTGRARFGSIRVPIWRGGGITFGPTGSENYSKGLSTKMKRTAIKQALSLAAAENKLMVIDAFEVKDGKTASALKLTNKLGLKKALIVIDEKTPETVRSMNNIQDINLIDARYLNVFDVMNANTIVFTAKSLTVVNEWLGGDK